MIAHDAVDDIVLRGKLYREWVIEARDGLRDVNRRSDAMTELRAMVERIVLTPEGDTLAIRLEGDLAAMLSAARNSKRSPDTGDLLVDVGCGGGI